MKISEAVDSNRTVLLREETVMGNDIVLTLCENDFDRLYIVAGPFVTGLVGFDDQLEAVELWTENVNLARKIKSNREKEN